MIFKWTVIGAGPAGIAGVGKLIDSGISAENIAWIDPKFMVGDFGTKWRNVPSNTKVERFLQFFKSVSAFNYSHQHQEFAINRTDPNSTCLLSLAAEPLQAITHELKKVVLTFVDMADEIWQTNRIWHVRLRKNNQIIQTKNIILAIGAEPKVLSFPHLEIIPLAAAMDESAIQSHLNEADCVAVFGSSHSAILVLKNLISYKVKKIINFYRSPLRYAVYLKDWILFDDTGLKGPTAEWARNHIDSCLPNNIERIFANEENIQRYLPQCNKVVYAIGFKRRTQPTIKGFEQIEYIEQCGILAPGLFGLGIAFPEAKHNPIGILEYRVGLWKFMEYLHHIMPIWLAYES